MAGMDSRPRRPNARWCGVVNDGRRWWPDWAGASPRGGDAAADALGLLALVAGQDVEPAEGSDGTDGRWRIARRVAPDRVISTVDTAARHTRKSKSARRDGFRGRLAAEPTTGLITDCELTKAAGDDGSDAVVGQKMIARDRYQPSGTGSDGGAGAARVEREPGVGGPEPGVVADHGPAQPDSAAAVQAGQSQHAAASTTGVAAAVNAVVAITVMAAAVAAIAAVMIDGGAPDTARRAGLEVYGDSAYGTGAARAAYQRGGHDTVIKPKPLLPAVAGGFTLDDFTIDEAAATVTCPGGHTRTMTAKRTVTFGAVCADCPLRARCTTATGGRSMSIHPYGQLLRAARAQARTPEFQQAYPTRSMVERIVAWTATNRGRQSNYATSASTRTTPGCEPVVRQSTPHTHQRRPEPAGRDLGTDLTTTHTPHPATPKGVDHTDADRQNDHIAGPKSRPTPQPRPSRRYNAPLPTLVQSLPRSRWGKLALTDLRLGPATVQIQAEGETVTARGVPQLCVRGLRRVQCHVTRVQITDRHRRRAVRRHVGKCGR